MQRPSTSSIRRSNSQNSSEEGWWIVEMTVLPSFARFLRSRMTWRAVVESSPVVGQSRKMMLGLVMSSTPMEVLLRSPPLMPLMKVLPTFTSAQLVSPSSLMRSSTMRCFSCSDSLTLRLQANWKHSRGVRVPSRASSCITQPIWLENGSTDLMGWLLNRSSPSTSRLSDISLPDRKLRRVVLPEPDGPRMAVKVAASMSPDCLWRMVLVYFLILAWMRASQKISIFWDSNRKESLCSVSSFSSPSVLACIFLILISGQQ